MRKPAPAGTGPTRPASTPSRLSFGVRPAPTRRNATLPVSLALHVVAVAALVLAPLLSRTPLPEVSAPPPKGVFFPSLPVPPEPPSLAAPVRAAGRRGGPPRTGPQRVAPPVLLPVAVTSSALIDPTMEWEPALPTDTGGNCLIGCNPDAPPSNVVIGDATGPDGEGPRQPLRVSSGPSAPRKVVHVAPAYPSIAVATRMQGSVVLDCIIDPLGRVDSVRVLSGHPLLAPAAVDAVRQWRYEPTRLNGIPVSVVLTVTVEFRIPR